MLKGRGKDDKIPFQIHKILQELLEQDVEIHFIRDGDGLNQEWRDRLNEFAQKANVKLHHLRLHEIENYVLSPELFFRTLKKKYPDKDVPSSQNIKDKILEVLKNTIKLNDYSFDDNLEDSIYKTGILLKMDEYRDRNTTRSKAKELRKTFQDYTNFDDLLRVGMGKETLKEIFNWLNKLGFNLSQKDLIANLDKSDIRDEVKLILEKLKSRESKLIPMDDESEMTAGDEN